jgi:hypothetical protein
MSAQGCRSSFEFVQIGAYKNEMEEAERKAR